MDNEEKVKQTDNEENIVKIPLITKLGEPNINGIIMDKDSFIKAMKSEYTKEIIKNGGMPLFVDSPDYGVVPIENIIGEVLFFNTEFVTVKITANMYNTYFGNNELDNYRAGLFVAGKFVAGKMKDTHNIFEIEKILGFQLLNRKSVAIKRII